MGNIYSYILLQGQTFFFFICKPLFRVLMSKIHSHVPADLDSDGHICDFELHELLKEVGHSQPGYMVRDIIQNLDRNSDNKISFDEFLSVRYTAALFAYCSEFLAL